MPKNLFEEIAIEQEREQLAKMKIIAKLKSNDLKGAHKLAKPYLEKINERIKYGGNIPTGWIKISQALCACDVQKNGIVKDKNQNLEEPDSGGWIRVGYRIVVERLRGATKSLVPATLALALVTMVLQPIVTKAETPTSYGIIPNSIVLNIEQVTGEGKLRVEAKSKLPPNSQEVTKPELEWNLKERGVGKHTRDSQTKLITSTMLEHDSSAQKISWSLDNIYLDPSNKIIKAKLRAKNSSRLKTKIEHFSMSDADYRGCRVELSSTVSKEFNEFRTPAEIPPKSSAVYEVDINPGSLPIIMFRSKDGETHSMILKVSSLEELQMASEAKRWATYEAINTSYQDIKIRCIPQEESEITQIVVERKNGNIELTPNEEIILHPGNRILFEVVAPPSEHPEAVVETLSRDSTRLYTLSSKDSENAKEKIMQTYQKILTRIFGEGSSRISWDEIETAYDKERSALVELTEEAPTSGNTLMSEAAKRGLEEAIKSEKLTTEPSKEMKSQNIAKASKTSLPPQATIGYE
jgi:hypothetical protein